MDGRSAELRDEDVTVLFADELVARLGVQAERDLVRHRRGRQEDRLLLAEQRSGARFELVDGRIFAPLLVADGSLGDGGAHPGGGPRRGVGAQVDHGAEPNGLRCPYPYRPCSAPWLTYVAATLARWTSSCSRARSPTAASRPSAPARCGSGLRAGSSVTRG